MRRQHPAPKMDIPVSMEVWKQLLRASMDSHFEKEDWEIAAEAIDEWVRRHDPDAISMPLVHGFQWKRLFLPNGTLLRTVFGGKNHHCLVEGDQILYNGQAVSPSGFVNAVGGIRRNAWRCTWLLFPQSKVWKLADSLRIRERPRRARTPAHDIPPTPVAQPAPVRVPVDAPPETGPLAASSDYTAASASDAFLVQHARPDRAPRTNQRSEQRNERRSGTTLSPPGFANGTDRRMKGDDRMVTLLRQELLPFLRRMSASDGTLAVHAPPA